MKAKSVQEAAEIALEFMYHWMYDIGEEGRYCVEAAEDIYRAITGEDIDAYEYLGLDREDIFE